MTLKSLKLKKTSPTPDHKSEKNNTMTSEMKRNLTTCLLAIAVLTAAAQDATGTAAEQAKAATMPKSICTTSVEQPLFRTHHGDSIPYRIPAIATASNGNIIAVSDYRYCGSDIGFGRVDLHYRISDDNGLHWTPERVMAEGDGIDGSIRCGYGDAAIVADSKSAEVLVVCVTGNTVYGHSTTTRKNPNRVAVIRSYDNGETWNAPEEITESIYSIFDKSALGPVQSLFFGSGRICQSRCIKVGKYHRIYAALCARPGGNRVIYSDDFGRTWQSLGTIDQSPAPQGDEPKIEELPTGDVVLSSRAWGGRHYNIFNYISRRKATGLWQEVAVSQEQKGGVVAKQNACNGEILIVNATDRKKGKTIPIALQSVPLGPGRSNVGIYYKPLYSKYDYATPAAFASRWQGPFPVSPINSAYSTMCMQPDGRIAFFYEEETYGPGAAYTEMYRPISIEEITGGAYHTKNTGDNALKRMLRINK